MRSAGAPESVAADLVQLFRRVVFNTAIGNCDDHLRNHGFLLTAQGWRLAPAFDVNPNIDKADHVLNLDDVDNRPRLESVLSTAEFYGLRTAQAQAVADEVLAVVDGWPQLAAQYGISQADIALTASAFSAHAEFRQKRL